MFLAKIQARYVRYADDIILFCSTKTQAEQLLGRIRDYLKEYLHLSINEEKTKIAHPWEIRYLGYSFLPVIWETGPDSTSTRSSLTYSLVLPAKTEARMLQRMKRNIRCSLSLSRKAKRMRAVKPASLWERLGGFNRGWIQYFRKADPSAMLRFLCEAEQYQVALLTKELHILQKEDRERILCALYTCRTFSTLTGWYVLRSLHGESFEERRLLDIMANKYSIWRSGSFYPSRTALYKSWGTFAVQPFFANRENGEEPHDFKVVQSDLPHLHTPVPPLSKTELCALGILAAGKNMTANQLAAFLKMKSVCLSVPEIQEMLQHFVAEGILEKASLYPARHPCPRKFCFPPPKAFEDPPAPSVSYRVFGRGKRLLRNIGAPVDNRIFYGTEEDRSVQTARFYMETVLFNQIILRCMLLCPGFRYYEICSVYNIPTQGKVYVPLLIESGEESYFFWHLDTDTAEAFETAIHNWELFYMYRRSCALVLVVSSDIVMQMAHVRLCCRKLSPNSGAVFLSEAAAWLAPSICRSGHGISSVYPVIDTKKTFE